MIGSKTTRVFCAGIEQARASLVAGRGVRLEDIETE
jgi:hypothetical protein